MSPISLLAPQKLQTVLLSNLPAILQALAVAGGVTVPAVEHGQILLSSAPPDLADSATQFSYPRICLYSSGIKNNQIEKFRTLSGSVSVVAEIWSSDNFVTETEKWIHFYVDAYIAVLEGCVGDLGDGLYFPGGFDVQFQQPKRGGFGFTQMAKVTCNLMVSR